MPKLIKDIVLSLGARHFSLQGTLTSLCLIIGMTLLSKGLYMDAKAQLAQVLIEYSWQVRDSNAAPSKPWWWADTKAIATLEVPRLNKRLFVMQDDSGESLAFGPGHLNASAQISQGGHVMIAGHRDSHFAFLKKIKTGDLIQTTNFDQKSLQYRVTEAYILDTRTEDLLKYQHDELTLITCYPFDSVISGGPLRYIVNAEPVKHNSIKEAINAKKLTKTPLTNQTKQPHQPKHYSKKLENMAHVRDRVSTIAGT